MSEPRITSIEKIAETFPDVLYKYRDWFESKHKTILTDQQVYFAPPSSFWTMGDPHDCRFPIAWNFSFDAHRPALDANFPYPDHKAKMTPDEYEFVLRQIYQENTSTPEARERSKDRYYNTASVNLGVLSVTGRNSDASIWKSAYAANFTGFCVGIDFKSCLQELANAGIGGGNVIYVSRDTAPLEYAGYSTHPHDLVMQRHMELIHTKYVEFEFENEYRLTQRYKIHPFGSPIPLAWRLFTVPKHCFRSVTFGYLMPQQSIDEIIKVCEDQQLPVSFYMATLTDQGTVEVLPYPIN